MENRYNGSSGYSQAKRNVNGLAVGEKYLVIKIAGHTVLCAFLNKDRRDENDPMFMSSGVKVYVRTKKEDIKIAKDEDLFV